MKGVFALAATGITGQAIGIAATFALSRLYAPDDFGTMAAFNSVLVILSSVACLRFELQIPVLASRRMAAQLVVVGVLAGLALGLASLLTTRVILPDFWSWLSVGDCPGLSEALCLLVVLQGFAASLSAWLTRSRRFGTIGSARLVSQVVSACVCLSMPAFGLGSALGLLIGLICSQVVLALAITGASAASIAPALSGGLRLHDLVRTLCRKKGTAVFGSLSALLNVLSWQTPIFGLTVCFGTAEVGQFALGMRLIQVPLQVLGSTFSQVFLQFGAEQNHNGSLAAVAQGVYRRLLTYTLFPGVLLGLVGVEAFSFAFGSEWRLAGEFAQILSPWACVWFLASPLSMIYVIKGRKREELAIHASLLLTRVTAIAIGAAVGDSFVAVVLLSVGGSLVYGAILWRSLRLAGVSSISMSLDALQALGYSTPFLLPVLLAKLIRPEAEFLVLSAAGASATAFALWLTIRERSARRDRTETGTINP